MTTGHVHRARRDRRLDVSLGTVLFVGGSLSLSLGLARSPGALAMAPAMDGCLVVGALAVLLPLVAGARYPVALAMLAPVAALELLGARTHHTSALAVLGLQSAIAGLMGLLAVARVR